MEPRTDDLRALLTRAVGDLPPMPDTVPTALYLGRRRLHRRRMAFAGGGLAVAAAVPATVTVLPDVLPRRTVATQPGGDSATPRATPTAAGTPRATPTSASAHDAYRQRVTRFLTDSLGGKLGRLTPQPGDFHRYDIDGPGRHLTLWFYVQDSMETGLQPASCERPTDPRQVIGCRTGRLADGTVVTAERWRFAGAPGTSLLTATFRRGTADVMLRVERQRCARGAFPIDETDLLEVATAPGLLALVEDWVGGVFPDTTGATNRPIPQVSVTPTPESTPSPVCR